MRRTSVLILLLVAALLATVPPAAAQSDTGAPPVDIFVDTLDVEVVNIEVTVTGKDGQPVRGLTRDDFVVLEDGEPVELTNFYAVEGGQRTLSPEEAAANGEDAGTAPLPEDQRLHLAVVVDNANIQPAHRARAIEQIEDHIARVLRPGDRVMVGALQPFPRVEQPFTEDLEAVDAALERIARSTVGQTALDAQYRRVQSLLAGYSSQVPGPDLSGSGGGGFGPEGAARPEDHAQQILDQIRSYGAQADNAVRRTFTAVGMLVDSLAGLPGRRSVLFVSGGVSPRPGEQLMEDWFLAFPEEARNLGIFSPQSETRQWDATDALMRVARKAAADQVTFYTLDAKGSQAGSGSVERMGIGAPGAGLADLSTQEPLLQLAAATGGWSMLNAANVDALLGQMASDYSDYYSLGYRSRQAGETGYHRIEVRVPGRKDLRIRHTEGYEAKTPASRMTERTLSALLLDVAANPLNVRLELGQEVKEKRHYQLPVVVKIPVSSITLVPQENAHHGRLSIFIVVQGESGNLSEPQRLEFPITIPNENLLTAMSQDIGYAIDLQLRGGDAKLAVGVRDDLAAVESTVNLNVSVGEG